MNYNLNQLADKEQKKKLGITAFKKLYSLIREEKRTIIFALIAIVVNAALNLLGPYLIGHTIDTYIQAKVYKGVLLFTGILLVMYITAFFTNYLQIKMMGGVGQRMKVLMAFLTDETGITVNGRYFTDSAPILERAWASRSGLGWIGKNSLLIHPKLGSYTLLAELIVDLEIEPDQPFGNSLCGACTRCIDSCPTGAIISPKVIDSNRCISYHTIEHKGPFTAEQEQLVNGHAFGCDICQEVCPWNKKPIAALQGKVAINNQLLELSATDWCDLNEDRFEDIFKGSAIKRAGFSGIIRNLRKQKQ